MTILKKKMPLQLIGDKTGKKQHWFTNHTASTEGENTRLQRQAIYLTAAKTTQSAVKAA